MENSTGAEVKEGIIYFNSGEDLNEDHQNVAIAPGVCMKYMGASDVSTEASDGSTEASDVSTEASDVSTEASGRPSSRFVVLDNSTNVSFKQVLERWGFDGYQPLHVKFEKTSSNEHTQENLYKKVMQSLETLQSFGVNIVCLFSCYNDYLYNELVNDSPESSVPCVRIYHSCSEDTLNSDYNVSYIGVESDNAVRYEQFTQYSHYLFTTKSHDELVSDIAQQCGNPPMIVYGVDIYDDDTLLPYERNHGNNDGILCISHTPFYKNSRPIARQSVSIDSVSNKNLLSWVAGQYHLSSEANIDYRINQYYKVTYPHLASTGILVSQDRSFTKIVNQLKRYSIYNAIPQNMAGSHPFVTDEALDTNKPGVVFKLLGDLSTRDMDTFYDILALTMKKLPEDSLILIVDLQALQFQHKHVNYRKRAHSERHTNSQCRCVTIMPWAVFNELGFCTESSSRQPGIVKPMRGLYNLNKQTDTYIITNYQKHYWENDYRKVIQYGKQPVQVSIMSISEVTPEHGARMTISRYNSAGDCGFQYRYKSQMIHNQLYSEFVTEAILACALPRYQVKLNPNAVPSTYINIDLSTLPSVTSKQELPWKLFTSLRTQNGCATITKCKQLASSMQWITQSIFASFTDRKSLVDFLKLYLSCKHECEYQCVKSFMWHPSHNYCYERIAKSAASCDADSLDHILREQIKVKNAKCCICDHPPQEYTTLPERMLSTKADDRQLLLVPILAHLGRTHELYAILITRSNIESVRFALYGVGIFRHTIKSRTKTQKTEKVHLEKFSTDLEEYAKSVVHNDTECQRLLPAIPSDMRLNAQELACMANASEFLAEPACKTGIRSVWWKELAVLSWWRIFLILFICPWLARHFLDTPTKIWDIYKIPAVKVIIHGCYHFIFIVLYSYMIIVGLDDHIDWSEYVIFVWMLVFSWEEVLQYRYQKTKNNIDSHRALWDLYIRSPWNKFDFARTFVYIIAVICRIVFYTLNKPLHLGVHILFCLIAMILYVKLLQFFTLQTHIGPLLVMICKMFMNDVIPFMIILLVILIGYAVIIHSLIFPHYNGSLDLDFIDSFLRNPYLQVYADVDFDEILAAPNKTSHCMPVPNADTRNYIGLFLAGFYMFVTNVLLLNLLIAMFNSSYNDVKRKSEYHSYQLMYDLWVEYERKNVLPPPISWLPCLYTNNIVAPITAPSMSPSTAPSMSPSMVDGTADSTHDSMYDSNHDSTHDSMDDSTHDSPHERHDNVSCDNL